MSTTPTLHQVGDQIWTVSNFLTAAECQQWIDRAEAQGFEEATIDAGFGKMVMVKSVRNNLRYIHDDPSLAEHLWERLKTFVPAELSISTACGINERFRFYKYLPGHRFKQHKDGSFIRNINEWSEYTFMVYLNDEMTGGATNFLQPHVSIKPTVGTALIFRHALVHEGEEVATGVKYVLRSDVMYRRK